MEGAPGQPALEGGVRAVPRRPGRGGFVEARRPAPASCGTSSPTRFRRRCEAPVHSMPPARETCCRLPLGRRGTTAIKLKVDPRVCRRRNRHRNRDHAAAARRRRPVEAGQRHSLAHERRQQIEYIATDRERQTIPWVKFTDRNGNVKEYVVDGTKPEHLAQGRTAIDGLHGLPQPSGPHVRAVARSGPSTSPIADGRLAAHAAVCATRSGRGAQGRVRRQAKRRRRGIDARLRKALRSHADRIRRWRRTITAVQDIYARTSSRR